MFAKQFKHQHEIKPFAAQPACLGRQQGFYQTQLGRFFPKAGIIGQILIAALNNLLGRICILQKPVYAGP